MKLCSKCFAAYAGTDVVSREQYEQFKNDAKDARPGLFGLGRRKVERPRRFRGDFDVIPMKSEDF